jgi:hypothetical protein
MKMSKSKKNLKNDEILNSNKNAKLSNIPQSVPLPNFPIWVPIIIFLVTTVIFFGPQLFGSAFFWEDFAEYIYPTQSFAASQFANGVIPHWNPYAFGGMPFLVDLQVGFFYPFNRILNLFINSNGLLPIWILQFIAILHFFIAQFSFYIFAKYLKISSIGAMIGAIAYAFAFPLVLHVIHPMIVFHLAWFPLIFYFFKKALDEGNISSGAIAGLIFGFTMLSGHPQITLYFAFILGIYFIWFFVDKFLQKNNEVKHNFIPFLSGIVMFVIAVGIFMIQFIPSNEMAKHSARSVTNYEKSAENSLQFKQVWSLLLPKVLGYYEADSQTDYPVFLSDIYEGKESQVKNNFYWETTMYFGIFPFLFGLFGLLTVKKDSFKWFLIMIIIFGFFYALGKNFPLHKIFSYIPFFGTFRNPVRMFTFSMFGLTLFSGFAFDYIAEKVKDKKIFLRFLLIFGIGFFLVFLSQIGSLQSILGVPAEFSEISASKTTLQFIILLLTILIGVLYIRNMLKPIIAGFAFVILVFLDLYLSGASFTQSKSNPQEQYVIADELNGFLKAQPPKSVYRVKTRMYSPSYMSVKRNQGVVSSFYMLEGYNPLMLTLAQVPLQWNKLFEVMNVKYDIRVNSQGNGVEFYQTENPLGPAFFAQKAKYMNLDDTKNFMLKSETDYSKEVIVNSEGIDLSNYSEIDSAFSSKLKVLEYKPNEMLYKASISKACIMVFSEIYYPAWICEIDGNKTDILQVNHSFRGIELPKGTHTIKMYYEDDKFAFGEILSICSIVIGIVLAISFRKNNI